MTPRRLVVLGPPRPGGFPSTLRALLRGELCSSCLAALQPAAPPKRDGGRVLPGVRIDGRDFPGRFLDELLGKLVHVRGPLT